MLSCLFPSEHLAAIVVVGGGVYLRFDLFAHRTLLLSLSTFARRRLWTLSLVGVPVGCLSQTHTHTLRGNYYLRPLFLGKRTLLIASLTAGGTYLKCVYVSSNGRGNGNGRRDADSDTQKCEGPERCSDCGCGTATPNNTHQTTPLMSAPFSITEPSKKGKSCER